LPLIENIVWIGNISDNFLIKSDLTKKEMLISVALQLCVIVLLGSSGTPEEVEIQLDVSASAA
jgi:hypothetical protein